ncbi:putative bifunctional diguanylate cyclase/phosphodiesterase [Dankookia sp. P2]|uniref:putative bifunctional diguanylate cyclase/phosphodiesterase n=1 Tax=Dankookia sp. P2 TaxID=3423955 RepID=UPI003D6681D3
MPWTSIQPLPARPRRSARALWAAALAGLGLGLPGGFGLAGVAPGLPTALALPLLGVAALLALPRLRRPPVAPAPDPLTGLPDAPVFRTSLMTALAEALPGRPPAILSLELDGFAAIRDTLGPEGGDALLRQAAARLVATARADDLVARTGQAEFAVLQRVGTQPDAAARFAGRLVRELSRPYALDDRPLICGAVAGIAIAEAGVQVDDLLAQSGMALRRARAEGQGTTRFFEPGMDTALTARHALEGALRQAAAAEDFLLHYQPVFAARSRRLLGFEALLRWSHPERGAVSPAEFVPVLEETGLILPVGAWVLRTACREAARWPEPIGVAVNLSPVQFRRGEVLGDVRAALAESGLAPHRLTLEITEGLLLEHTDAVLDMLRQLHGLGVCIALDDFGSGYSSLAYLWRFRFDTLKIDRAFVREVRRDGKAAAIVEIHHRSRPQPRPPHHRRRGGDGGTACRPVRRRLRRGTGLPARPADAARTGCGARQGWRAGDIGGGRGGSHQADPGLSLSGRYRPGHSRPFGCVPWANASGSPRYVRRASAPRWRTRAACGRS